MEYIYAAMLIHKAGGKIDEITVKKTLEAAGVKPDEGRVKTLVAALDGVNIEEAIKEAASVVAAPAKEAGGEAKKEEKSPEKKKEEEQKAAAGLGALFG